MNRSSIGDLHRIQNALIDLVQNLPEHEIKQRFHPQLASLGWLLGRSVYLELYWLRKKILQDTDLVHRVQHIFAYTQMPSEQQEKLLPPKDHLLNWALEIQETHLTYLANPNHLPAHPWLNHGWLIAYMIQSHALIYERMLMSLQARSLQKKTAYRVKHRLQSQRPVLDAIDISQGHYRIGARADQICFDNEQPIQMVELANFSITKKPINNANWLAFMEEGGYHDPTYWSELGWVRRAHYHIERPWHWRQDERGYWYSIGLNGPADLHPEQPVRGISFYEAEAFARWANEIDGFKQAALPHEFHWEAAARLGVLDQIGQVWEWCAAPFQPYQNYQEPADIEMKTEFEPEHWVMRGTCLHTQNYLRRLSIRAAAPAQSQYHFSGLRLIIPSELSGDELYRSQWQSFLTQK